MARKTGEKAESFENRLIRLEELVGKLEAGDLPLEQAVELFEEGMKLSQALKENLDAAEKRIEVWLTDETGKPVQKSFTPTPDLAVAADDVAEE